MKHSLLKGIILGSMLLGAYTNVYAAQGETKTFDVLTYNVAGLPCILSSSNPTQNTNQISPLLNQYDIIAVQEDFAYHRQLISQVVHPYLTKHSGNVPFGDGMNFISKYPLKDVKRIAWNKTYGIFSNGSDQLTPKGFMYAKLQLEEGVYVDLYTLHTDADTDDKSLAARRDNMLQLAAYIEENSAGNAVIVMGDTNSRYTRAGDNFETALLESCGLADAWIELKRDGEVPADGDALINHENRNSGSNEVVDKVFYRSNDTINLKAIDYALDEVTFTNESGEQLSDHYPIHVAFSYSVEDKLLYSEAVGGDGGIAFNALGKLQNQSVKPCKITLRSGNRIDGLGITYDNGETFQVGGNGGTLSELTLAENEYITAVTVGTTVKNGSERIGYMDIATNLGNHLTGGKPTNQIKVLEVPNASYTFLGIWGRAEAELDQIGLIYKQK